MKIQVDSSPQIFTPAFIQEPYDRLSNKTDIPWGFHTILIVPKNNESMLSLEALKEQSRLVSFLQNNFDVETISAVDVLNKEIEQKYNRSIEDVRDDEALGEIMYDLFASSPKDFESAAGSMLAADYSISSLEKRYLLDWFFPLFSFFDFGKSEPPHTNLTIIDLVLKNRSMGKAERKQLSITIRESVDRQDFTYIRPIHYSYFLLAADIDGKIASDAALLGMLTLISMTVLLFLGFRRLYFVFIPLFITAIVVVLTFSTAVILDIKITCLSTFVVALIAGVGVDGSIHIMKRFLEERKKSGQGKAIRLTMSSILPALFLASFTTIAAFLANIILPSPLALNSFAIVVVMGMGYAFLVECLLTPALLSLRDQKPASGDVRIVREAMNWVFEVSVRYTYVIIAILLIALLLSLYNLGKIETNVSGDMFVPEGVPSKEAIRIRDSYTSEYASQFVMIEGDVKRPEVLAALDRLEENVQDDEMLEKAGEQVVFESVNTLMRQANISENINPKVAYDRLYQNNATADPINKLTFADKAKVFLPRNGGDYDTILVVVRTVGGKADFIMEAYDELMEDVRQSGLGDIPGVSVELVGNSFWSGRTELYLRKVQIISAVLMFLFTLVSLLLTYRKLVLSVLVSLQILLASFFSLGLMPLFNMPLTWLNATVIALIIGLGVDYSIYLAERYREELKNNKDRKEAARIALEETGNSLWLDAATTIAAFGIISFSFLPMAQSFGMLTAISIFLVFLITIFLLPPLLIRFVKD